MEEIYYSQSMGKGWPEAQIGWNEKLWLIMKRKWAESCRTSVLLQKAARPNIQGNHMELKFPPPRKEISTVGHRPRFAFTPSCNIKHLIYCRHNSSLVCETLLTLILLRFLTRAQKFPRLGFGGHTMQEDAGVKETFCHWLGRELLILSPFHLDFFSLCDFF